MSPGAVERELDERDLVNDIAYSPDGRLLAGGTFAGWIGLWDPATGVRTRRSPATAARSTASGSARTDAAGFGGPRPRDPDLGRRDREPPPRIAGP